jgi:hypothetical protein
MELVVYALSVGGGQHSTKPRTWPNFLMNSDLSKPEVIGVVELLLPDILVILRLFTEKSGLHTKFSTASVTYFVRYRLKLPKQKTNAAMGLAESHEEHTKS